MARVGLGYRLEIENGWLSMQRQTKKSSPDIRKNVRKRIMVLMVPAFTRKLAADKRTARGNG